MSSRVKWLSIFLLVIFSDQASKVIFAPKVLNNSGAFGFGGQLPWLFLTFLALAILLMWWRKTTDPRERMTATVIVASGVSNLLDRILLGGVRDFIWWPILSVYGNLADLYLTIAVFALFFISIKRP